MGQVPTVLRQAPQRHARWSPARATAGDINVVGSCANSATPAIASTKAAVNLRLHCLRRTRKSDDLRSCVLIANLAGDQADDGAGEQDPEADPDPGDQRELVELERRFARIWQHAGIV